MIRVLLSQNIKERAKIHAYCGWTLASKQVAHRIYLGSLNQN